MSTADALEEELNLQLESEMIDTDMDRVIYAMNLNNWIPGAQDVLDLNNDYDREMLANIASYVDRKRHPFAENSIFGPASEERLTKSVLMSREDIVLPRAGATSARKCLRFDQLLQQALLEITPTIDHHVSTPEVHADHPRVPPQEVPSQPLNANFASADANTCASIVTRAPIPSLENKEEENDLVPQHMLQQLKAAEEFRDTAQREKEKVQKRLDDLRADVKRKCELVRQKQHEDAEAAR